MMPSFPECATAQNGLYAKTYTFKDVFVAPLPAILAWQPEGSAEGPDLRADGGLIFTFTPRAQGYTKVNTKAEYDLRGSCVSIELAQPLTNFANGANAELALEVSRGGDRYSISLRPGFAVAGYTLDAGDNEFYPATLNGQPPGAQYRLREANGTLFYEASRDGGVYLPFYSRALPWDVSRVRIGISGVNWSRYDAGSVGIVSDLNVR